MLDYGFEQNQDYIVLDIFVQNLKTQGGRPSKDYFITIDCAKEISMIQRSNKGKKARQYFIECERKLQQSKALKITPKDKSKG